MKEPNAPHPFIAEFCAAWENATLDSLMSLLPDDVILVQPLSPPLMGKHAARRAFAKILFQYPGLYGKDFSGLGDDHRVMISWTMCVPVGRRFLQVPIVDDFEFAGGTVKKRTAYFDSGLIVRAVAKSPSALWRQAISPFKRF